MDKLFDEVGGAIDQSMELAGYEALQQQARDGDQIPIWENGKTVLKPAVEVLAQVNAERAIQARKKPRARRS